MKIDMRCLPSFVRPRLAYMVDDRPQLKSEALLLWSALKCLRSHRHWKPTGVSCLYAKIKNEEDLPSHLYFNN